MKKGEIYFANLDPTIGSEVKKVRPVLIISNDANNKHNTIVTVIPLTSQTDKIYPFEVLLTQFDTGLPKDSKAQCGQIRTISKQRITSTQSAGVVNQEIMDKIHQAIKVHLDFE